MHKWPQRLKHAKCIKATKAQAHKVHKGPQRLKHTKYRKGSKKKHNHMKQRVVKRRGRVKKLRGRVEIMRRQGVKIKGKGSKNAIKRSGQVEGRVAKVT